METLAVDENERLALLAHEIRSSLTAIQGFGITLREHLDDLVPRDRTAAIDAIVRGSDTLLALADELLEAEPTESGALRLRYEWVDLAVVAREVVDSQLRLHSRVDIELAVSGSLPVVGDPITLGRALDNLIRNAVRHAPTGSCVEVEATQVLDMIAVSVRNEGAPLPQDVPAHLFEKYSSFSEGGTGLGLYLTRKIVEAHGGSIWYTHDEGENWFSFVVPTHGAVARKDPASRPA